MSAAIVLLGGEGESSGEYPAAFADARADLRAIERFNERQARRAASVFELLDSQRIDADLALAQEFAANEGEIRNAVARVRTVLRGAVERAIASARSTYEISMNLGILLGSVGILAMVAGSVFALRLLRARS